MKIHLAIVCLILSLWPAASRGQNTGNNPGNPNAGGYNGNYSGSTHNGTGVAGGDRTGGYSYGGSGNTGNNPGNPNAGGYNGNYSGSTHGGSGAYGGNGGSGSDRNTGNNPGNPNAGGYNGNYSGSTHGGSGVAGGSRAGAYSYSVSKFGNGFDPSKNTELGSNADRSAQRAGIDAGTRASNAAGVKSNSNEWTKAYYNALVSSYEKAELDPHVQSLPSGPMNAIGRMSHKANFAERNAAAAIDEAYRTYPDFQIHMPHELSRKPELAKTAVQKLGLMNSVVVEAPLATLQRISAFKSIRAYRIGITAPTFYNDVLLGGLIAVANDNKNRYATALAHEAFHAGVAAVASHAKGNWGKASKDVAEAAYEAATSMHNHGAYSEPTSYDPAYGVGVPNSLLGSVVNQEEEIAAFMVSEDKASYISVLQKNGLSLAQANKVANALQKSKGLKDAMKAMESYLNKSGIKGAGNE